MKRRVFLFVAGILLLLVAWRLPTAWYDTLPRAPGTPPLPFRGVELLRLTFLFEALVFFWLAARNWTFKPIPLSERLTLPLRNDAPEDLSRSSALIALAIVTLVALLLRTYHLGSDLWLDEITPIVDYGHMPFVQVIGSYLRTNNHLLNTLLIKLMIGLFGEREWAVRLPAMLFGVATVPALYWLARLALSRWASVAAAAVLAVSYHHILFSQNARGYSAYVFFAVLTAGLLIRCLTDDRLWRWAAYAIAMLFGFASLAHMAFVFASHAIIGGVAVVMIRKRGGSGLPLLRRLAVVLGIAGFLSFQLYSAPLPEMYAVITHLYVTGGTGYSPGSAEFLREIVRGVSAGFGGIAPTLVVALAGAAGLAILFRLSWLLTLALALPPILTALFLAVRGLSFSPRFFLLLLPLGILTVLAAAEMSWTRLRTAGHTTHPRRAAIVGVLLVVVSVLTLPHYYSVPKQSYRSAIAYLERIRQPEERVVVVYAAEGGFRYYTRRPTVHDPVAYHYARTLATFDSLTAAPRSAIVVTTLPHVLRGDLPALAAEIDRDWAPVRIFPATIGGGEITVWKRKSECSPSPCIR
jgi:hypothetical protein